MDLFSAFLTKLGQDGCLARTSAAIRSSPNIILCGVRCVCVWEGTGNRSAQTKSTLRSDFT